MGQTARPAGSEGGSGRALTEQSARSREQPGARGGSAAASRARGAAADRSDNEAGSGTSSMAASPSASPSLVRRGESVRLKRTNSLTSLVSVVSANIVSSSFVEGMLNLHM